MKFLKCELKRAIRKGVLEETRKFLNKNRDTIQEKVQNGIKEDIQNDVKEKVQENIKKEILNDIEKETPGNIKERIQNNIERKIQDDVKKDILDDIEKENPGNIKERIQNSIKGEIQNNIKGEIQKNIQKEIQSEIQENIERNIENTVKKKADSVIEQKLEVNIQEKLKKIGGFYAHLKACPCWLVVMLLIPFLASLTLYFKNKATPSSILEYFTMASLSSIILCLSLITLFLAIKSIHEKFNKNGKPDFWGAATSSFTLLGVLIAIGAAFATVAGVVSYVSVNDKLKFAEKELTSFKDLLTEKEELKKNIRDIKEYNNQSKNLNSPALNEKLLNAAKNIIKVDNAPFYDKVKSYAIINNELALKALNEGSFSDSENLFKKSLEYWKILSLYNQNDIANYNLALYNLAISKVNMEKKSSQPDRSKITSIYQDFIQNSMSNSEIEDVKKIDENLFNNIYVDMGDNICSQALEQHENFDILSENAITYFKKADINNYILSIKNANCMFKLYLTLYKNNKNDNRLPTWLKEAYNLFKKSIELGEKSPEVLNTFKNLNSKLKQENPKEANNLENDLKLFQYPKDLKSDNNICN